MMMEPQITLITFSAVLVILDLNRDTIVDNPNHHVADAQHTPVINAKLSPGGREALNAPRSIVPSMIACGLNQVTTQAVVMILEIGMATFVLLSISAFDRTILMPM